MYVLSYLKYTKDSYIKYKYWYTDKLPHSDRGIQFLGWSSENIVSCDKLKNNNYSNHKQDQDKWIITTSSSYKMEMRDLHYIYIYIYIYTQVQGPQTWGHGTYLANT